MRFAAIAIAFFVSAGIIGLTVTRAVARVGVHQGYAPEQPIAFSHRIHAGDWKVPCQYCHYGASRSRHAGIPPASVCMNCHTLLTRQTDEIERLREAVQQRRPIAWIKVHNLPDFVHFDHSRHLLARLSCRECHGPIDQMDRVAQQSPLTMGWCLECHEHRGPKEPNGKTDCARCHY
jgi:hypothetical protein